MIRKKLHSRLAILFAVVTLLGAKGSLSQSGVSYVYDDLGRLVGVIDPSGNAAAYSYDAVGNLLGINRYTSSQISVLNFSPRSGPPGTTVTITGTAFSATASQDSVSFNGTSATVSSAAVNQLVVTVPTGATTGPIQVTSPAGTFTTATNFSVTASNGAPTITSFSPSIATAGTALTINGTNFSTTLASNRLTLNITPKVPASATTTSISTTVPGSTASGKIFLSTPGGSAVSSQDLYVPFGTHVASDVGYTNRTTLGSTATVSIATAGKIGLLLFDATAGQRLSLSLSGSTLSICTLYVVGPTAFQLQSGDCTSATSFLDSVTLPQTGTYTVGVDPGTASGSVSVTLNNASDVIANITPGGSAVTVTTTVPGQDARLLFTGTVGQMNSVQLSNISNPFAYVQFVRPDTATMTLRIGISSGGSPFLDTQTLPSNGPYSVWVQHYSTDVGSETLQMYNDPDVTATITTDGTPVTVTTTSPGQDARVTFTETANHRVSFQTSNITNPSATVNLLKPDGTVVTFQSIYSGGTYFTDPQTLSQTGTYTLWVQHWSKYDGSETLQVWDVPADPTGTITVGGASVPVTTTVPGQDASLTFSGTAGQQVSVHVTNDSYSSVSVALLNPSGGQIIGVTNSGSFNLASQTLPTTGTYTIFVDPQGTSTGTLTVSATSP